jgi:threonine synthase
MCICGAVWLFARHTCKTGASRFFIGSADSMHGAICILSHAARKRESLFDVAMLLICSQCSAEYSTEAPRWRCACGGYLRLQHSGMFRREALAGRPHNMWRYREALGVSPQATPVSLGEGWTPLEIGTLDGRNVLLKLDYLCPTGSYKDRGGSAMLTQLKHWGVPRIIEDSSGNAGAAVAAYAAKASIECEIYIPATTSEGKAAQIAMYGGNLRRIAGSREATTDAAFAAAEDGGFYASHNWSPYFVAGMKTIAYEIAEQMNWQAPDWVVLPVGGGGLLSGVYMGFRDLVAAGLLTHAPQILAVQSAACNPVERAWAAGLKTVPAIEKRATAAEGISVARPVRGEDVLEAVRGSHGRVVTVDDDDIWAACEGLARQGVYVEPTAAAAPAAVQQAFALRTFAPAARVVVVLTGMGLKATDKIVERMAGVESAAPLAPAVAPALSEDAPVQR